MTEDHCLCFPLHQCSDMVAFKVPPESLTGWRMKLFIDGVVLQVLNSWLLLFAFTLACYSAAVFVVAVEAIGMDFVTNETLLAQNLRRVFLTSLWGRCSGAGWPIILSAQSLAACCVALFSTQFDNCLDNSFL